MIAEVIVVGLVVSAFLAVYLDEAIYSAVSLAATVIFLSILYFDLGATYVAVFQFSVGVGTVITLFLSGEMLSTWHHESINTMKLAVGTIAAALLSVAVIFSFPEAGTSHSFSDASFSTALWNFRVVDILAQGIVVLTLALGVTIILQDRTEKEE